MILLDKKRQKKHSAMIVQVAEDALANLEHENVKQFKYNMTPEGYRTEFGLVQLHLPRQSGHTTAGLELIVKHPGSLMFVNSENDRQNAIGMLCREYTSNQEIINHVKDSVVPIHNENRILSLRPLDRPRPFIIFDYYMGMNEGAVRFVHESFMSSDIYLVLQGG